MSIENIFQSWLIPFDILNLICLVLVIILALIFLFLIIFNKTCHTVPMILVANSCSAELIFAGSIFSMAIFTLTNDLLRREYNDSFCIFRGYAIYVGCYAQNYSYFLQAIYRYTTVVYPARLFWRSAKFQLFLISLMWMSAVISVLPHIFYKKFLYLIDDQMCEMPSELSFVPIYNVTWFFIIPVNSIIFIYFKLVRYVKEMNKHVMLVNTLIRAERELKMVYRIVILVTFLAILGIPYATFTIMGFFTSPPKYHFRIAYIFVNISLTTIITFHNDLKQFYSQDSFCMVRTFISYVISAELFYSYLLQAIYRTRLFWQSAQFQFFLISLTWICAFLHATPHIFTGQ
ncbi:unnamed protein product [Adineta steineri]|uniref:G-protein coupled receptors family 1 profile domain-containing protein n=1 Tax=Adineta steineri TaxID=433720 RepID=A0A814M8L3_9BILA|nr:unnamed protein product [Adineta steineri]CAF1075191.1 unnamed protein product [Adineta steineri]